MVVGLILILSACLLVLTAVAPAGAQPVEPAPTPEDAGLSGESPEPADGNPQTDVVADGDTPSDSVPSDLAPSDTMPADTVPADPGPADPGPTEAQPADSVPADASSNGDTSDATPTDGQPDGQETVDDPLVNEAPGEDAPATDVTVPPKQTYGGQGEYQRPEVLWSSVAAAEEKVSVLSVGKQEAIAEVHRLRRRLKELGAGKNDLDDLTLDTIEEIDSVTRRLQNRAVTGFQRLVSGADADTEASMTDFQAVIEAQRRSKLVESTLDVDEEDLDRLGALRAGLDGDARDLVDRMRVVRQNLEDAELVATEAADEVEQAELEFHAFRAGSEIFIHGVVFPIAGEYAPVTDSFGFPRMSGTPDEHWHEGIDLFAERGTPLVAAERGVIAKLGSGRLGGLKFWLKGESGTEWYYAHLDSFAPGLANGQVVEAGELVGYVGNTGNAVGTPPHLHMQVHPDGGRAVNPFPLLKVVSDLDQASGEGPIYDYEIYTVDATDEVAADADDQVDEPAAEVPADLAAAEDGTAGDGAPLSEVPTAGADPAAAQTGNTADGAPEPDTTAQPDTAAQPVDTAQPDTAAQPVDTAQPDTAAQPDTTAQPDTAVQPDGAGAPPVPGDADGGAGPDETVPTDTQAPVQDGSQADGSTPAGG